MNDIAAKILPRLAGIIAGYLVSLAAKYLGLTLDAAEVTTLVLTTYALVHRAVSQHTNPGDATKSALIAQDKRTVKAAQLPPAAR